MVKLHGAVLPALTNFPSNPKDGQIAFVNDVLYSFIDVDGANSWYPITNRTERHSQTIASASTTWVVPHDLNSINLLVLCYDDSGSLIVPQDITYDTSSQITVTHATAQSGRCVLFIDAAQELTAALSGSYAASKHEVTISGSATDTITLPWTAEVEDISVYINGVRQLQEAYTIVDGDDLLLDEEIPVGTKVCVVQVDDTYLDTVAYAEQAGYTLDNNLIINGDFSLTDYRTYIDNPTSAEEYNSLNRWRFRRANNADECRFGQSSYNGPNSGSCLYMRRNNGDTDLNTFIAQQQIESIYVYPVMGKKLTVSFKLMPDAGWLTRWGDSDIKIAYGTSLNESIAIGATATGEVALIDEVTIPAPSVYDEWTEYSFTTSGVIPSTALCLYLKFRFGVTGTAPADEFLRMCEVKVQPGEIATPWRGRPEPIESKLCERYLQDETTSVANAQPMWAGNVTSGDLYYYHVALNTPMRTTPTLTVNRTSEDLMAGTFEAQAGNNKGFRVMCTADGNGRGFFRFTWRAESEL